MSYFDVPGASLYYETVGQGPMLLCISGADGSADIWRGMADCLKNRFTVVIWDRRGFSRSYLTGAQDYEHRIERDVDDAAALVQHISPSEPATIIGNSSGAIVALKFLSRHPDLVRTLVSYEPPAATLVPGFDDIWKQHEETYALYRSSGVQPALEKFAQLTKADQKNLAGFIDFRRPYLFSNTMYWFEREFLYYPKTAFSVDGELRPLKHKLVLVNGVMSPSDAYQYRANAVLAEKLGLELLLFPGEHVGHATHPQEFAKELVKNLEKKSQ